MALTIRTRPGTVAPVAPAERLRASRPQACSTPPIWLLFRAAQQRGCALVGDDRDHLQGVAVGYTTFFGKEPELLNAKSNAAILDRYVGEYKTPAGSILTFRRDGAALFVKAGTNPEIPLVARSQTRFSDPRGPVIEFQLDAAGKVTGLGLPQKQPPRLAGVPVRDLKLPRDSALVTILRGGRVIVPGSDRSVPSARAGSRSVPRSIASTCMTTSGSGIAPPEMPLTMKGTCSPSLEQKW